MFSELGTNKTLVLLCRLSSRKKKNTGFTRFSELWRKKKTQVLLGSRSSEQKKKHCKYNVFVILWFGGKNKCVWGLFRLNQKELASMAHIGLVASDRVEGFFV